MRDKQIIIDGVDVSKCEGIDLSLHPLAKCKFLKFKTSDGGIAGIWCFDHTKCNFKQLARKTQECEKYEQALNGIEEICLKDVHTFADGTELRYDALDEILDIISKATDRKNEN